MKISRATALAVAALACFSLQPSAQAEGKFHFPVGLTYSQGALDSMDTVMDMYEAEWEAEYGPDIDFDPIKIPIGLVFSPYYEWDFGLGVGVSVGPTTFIVGSIEVDDGYDEDYDTRFTGIIPVGLDLRYTLFRERSVAPYARLGFRYPIAFGDNVDSSQPGVFGGVGVEFLRNKKVSFGIEVGYDTSVVEFEALNGNVKDEVTFAGFTAGAFVVF